MYVELWLWLFNWIIFYVGDEYGSDDIKSIDLFGLLFLGKKFMNFMYFLIRILWILVLCGGMSVGLSFLKIWV